MDHSDGTFQLDCLSKGIKQKINVKSRIQAIYDNLVPMWEESSVV
jgi:hypothetical protein